MVEDCWNKGYEGAPTDGSAWNISEGILRRRYDARPAGGVPAGSTEIRIELWPTSMVFKKGHRLRLEVELDALKPKRVGAENSVRVDAEAQLMAKAPVE